MIGLQVFAQTDATNKLIDSLLSLPDDTTKIEQLNKILWQSINDSAICNSLAYKIIDIAEKINYPKGVAIAQKNLAAYYFYSGDYSKALELYQESLKIFEEINYKEGIAKNYRNIGNIHYQLGNNKIALEKFYKSLAIREELKDTIGIAKTYNAIGQLFAAVPEYFDSSAVYFYKALKIFEQKQDIFNIAITYINLANYYYQRYYELQEKKLIDSFAKIDTNRLNQLEDTAFDYVQKSIQISKQYSIDRLTATAYEIKSQIFSVKGQFDSVEYYLMKSLDIRKANDNNFGIVSIYIKLGDLYLLQKKYTIAKQYLTQAVEMSQEIGSDYLSKDAYKALSDYYFITNNFKEAYKALKRHDELKDSLENEENTKKLTQLSMQFEFDKKQKILEIQRQQELQRQKLVTRFFFIGFVFTLLLALMIFRSYRQKKKNNEILREKNDLINRKNALLNQQKEEIEAQRDEIEEQKNFVEKQNREIKASINYAHRIQKALLTPVSFFENNLKDYFILYKPRDIVSGDFFWGTEIGDKIIFTAADCTGHGVPGAFMSVLGMSFLNQIISEYDAKLDELSSALVLNKLKALIIKALGHGEDAEEHQEGMDMALIVIDKKSKKINFAGAYNPMLLIRNEEMQVIDADKMPVGYHFHKKDARFTDKFVEYQENDCVYIFSDGYADQFGGEKGRKFSPKRLRQTLLEIHKLPMQEQREILNQKFEDWRNSPVKKFRQLDDVLVIGFIL